MRRPSHRIQAPRLEIRSDQSFERSASSTILRDSDTESVFIDSNMAKEFLFFFQAEDKRRHKTAVVSYNPIDHESNYIIHQFSYSNKLKQELNNFMYFSHHRLKIPKPLLSVLSGKYKCPALDTSDVINRMYGAFVGFIIGDSVGSYLAFHVHKIDELVLKALLMNGGGTYNTNPGQGTADTELAFALAYGLIEGNGIYKANVIAKHYALWLKSKPFDTSALVLIALKACREINIDQNSSDPEIVGLSHKIKKAALKNAKQESNIGLIRLVPLAIWTIHLSEEDTETIIRMEMALLNPNKLVVETAIIFVKTLHILFKKGDHQEAFHVVSKWVYEKGSPEILKLWDCVEKNLVIPSKGSLGKLKTSFSYSYIEMNQIQVDFLEGLIDVLRKGGDADTNAAIVCSMMGAVVGYNQIPSYFRYKVMNAEVNSGHKPRPQQYKPRKVVQLVQKLYQSAPNYLIIQD